jgi:hypothetical protein
MNRQIGEPFLMADLFSAFKADHRFSLRMSEDRDLRKTVEKITRSMSYVKACPGCFMTPFLHKFGSGGGL